MTADGTAPLAAVVAALDPDLRAAALPEPGPSRFAGVPDPDRAFVLEAVYEGFQLHHGQPRAFGALDPDLALLAGDSLYSLGLARLAARGDLDAIAELADLISLCAWAQAEGRPDLVEELWRASEERLGHGRGPGARAALEAGVVAGSADPIGSRDGEPAGRERGGR